MDDPQETGEQVVETEVVEDVTTQSESPTDEIQTPLETDDAAEKPDTTLTEDNESEEAIDALQKEPKSAKAFQEMRQEIKRLKSELGEKQRRESVFNTIKPSVTPVAPVEPQLDQNRYIDPSTGQFNQDAYNRDYTLKMQEQQRIFAQQSAQQQTLETIDEMRAKDKYPQLDPDSEAYNPDFERDVAAEWFLQKYLGQSPSISKIAEKKMRSFMKDSQRVEAQAAEEEGVKEQASLSPATRSKPGYGGQERLESLRRKTRTGDIDALVERMKHIKS